MSLKDEQIPCSRCKYKLLLEYSRTVLESKAAVDKLRVFSKVCSHCRKNILLGCHEAARDFITLHDRTQHKRETIPDKKSKRTPSQNKPITIPEIKSKTIKGNFLPPRINKIEEFPSQISLEHERHRKGRDLYKAKYNIFFKGKKGFPSQILLDQEPEHKSKDLLYPRSKVKEKKQQISYNEYEDIQRITTGNSNASMSTLDTLRMQDEITKARTRLEKDDFDKQSVIGSSKSEIFHSKTLKKSIQKVNDDRQGMEKQISALHIDVHKKLSSKSDYFLQKPLPNDDFSYYFLKTAQDENITLENYKSSLEILDEMRKRKEMIGENFFQKTKGVESKDKMEATDKKRDVVKESDSDNLLNKKKKKVDENESSKPYKSKQDDANNTLEELKTTTKKSDVKKKQLYKESDNKRQQIIKDPKHTDLETDTELKKHKIGTKDTQPRKHSKEDNSAQLKKNTKVDNEQLTKQTKEDKDVPLKKDKKNSSELQLQKHSKGYSDTQLKKDKGQSHQNNNSKIVDNQEKPETKLMQNQKRDLKKQDTAIDEKKDTKKNDKQGIFIDKNKNSKENALQSDTDKKQGNLQDTEQKVQEEFDKTNMNKKKLEEATGKIQEKNHRETLGREKLVQLKQVPDNIKELLKLDRSGEHSPKVSRKSIISSIMCEWNNIKKLN